MEEKKALPDGIEWPRYTDGRLVRIGGCWQQDGFDESVTYVDSVSFAEDGVRLENEYNEVFYRYGERVKRPAPKVLDADGEEIGIGDKLYDTETGCARIVRAINSNGTVEFDGHDDRGWFANHLTHRAPVLAADGKPLREGDKPYRVDNGKQVEVRRVDPDYGEECVFVGVDGSALGYWLRPGQLTHERPEVDSWSRFEEDAEKDPCGYFGFDEEETCSKCPASGKNCEQTMARDLVRRAKKLADDMQKELDECSSDHEIVGKLQYQRDRIREALGVDDGR